MQFQYYKSIDNLRGFAILLVLIAHFAGYIGDFFDSGYYGVDLFFTISGFLITNILINQENQSFGHAYKNFMGRRILRIFPIYYLTIFILYLFEYQPIQEYIFYHITYTFNYAWVIENIPLSAVSHFWSLCVEEQFYLFWPIIVLLLSGKPKVLLYLLLSIILFGIAQMVFNIIPQLSPFNKINLLTRMSSLGMGALAAILIKMNKLPYSFFTKKWIEYTMLFILILFLFLEVDIKYAILPVCSFYFIIKGAKFGFTSSALKWIENSNKLLFIGTISYGIYIYHLPIDYYTTKYLFDPIWHNINFKSLGVLEKLQYHPWIFKFPLYSTLSISIAWISHSYLEKPILKLKDVFFKYN